MRGIDLIEAKKFIYLQSKVQRENSFLKAHFEDLIKKTKDFWIIWKGTDQ